MFIVFYYISIYILCHLFRYNYDQRIQHFERLDRSAFSILLRSMFFVANFNQSRLAAISRTLA